MPECDLCCRLRVAFGPPGTGPGVATERLLAVRWSGGPQDAGHRPGRPPGPFAVEDIHWRSPAGRWRRMAPPLLDFLFSEAEWQALARMIEDRLQC